MANKKPRLNLLRQFRRGETFPGDAHEQLSRFDGLLFSIHQPEQNGTRHVNRAVSTDDHSDQQAEGKSVNAFPAENIQDRNNEKRCQ